MNAMKMKMAAMKKTFFENQREKENPRMPEQLTKTQERLIIETERVKEKLKGMRMKAAEEKAMKESSIGNEVKNQNRIRSKAIEEIREEEREEEKRDEEAREQKIREEENQKREEEIEDDDDNDNGKIFDKVARISEKKIGTKKQEVMGTESMIRTDRIDPARRSRKVDWGGKGKGKMKMEPRKVPLGAGGYRRSVGMGTREEGKPKVKIKDDDSKGFLGFGRKKIEEGEVEKDGDLPWDGDGDNKICFLRKKLILWCSPNNRAGRMER